jgi:hypothetical protein
MRRRIMGKMGIASSMILVFEAFLDTGFERGCFQPDFP